MLGPRFLRIARVCLAFLAAILRFDPASAVEPVVIAHRGASGYLPEHTLEAVAFAHAQGADYIEQDVVMTKDRVPVVLHDIQIDTVTDVVAKFPNRHRGDGRFYAIDFTLVELKTLAAHERIDLKTGKPVFPRRFPLRKGSFQIPTLDEELDLIAGLNESTRRTAGVYAEIKDPLWHRKQGFDISVIVLETLARHGYATKADRCFLQCFDPIEVKRIRDELGYKGLLVQLIGERREPQDSDLTTDEALADLAKFVDGIGPSLPLVVQFGKEGAITPTDLTQRAHGVNIVVHPYTFRGDALPPGVSAASLLRTLFDSAKVDGVFADQPDQVLNYLHLRGE